MSRIIKNPVSIISAGDAGATDSSVKITSYDKTTGVIKGQNFGQFTGWVYLLNRNTHSYIAQQVSAWGEKEIVLSNPIDTSTIEGHTCFFVRTSTYRNSTKWLLEGDVAVTGWAYLYVKNKVSGTIDKLVMNSNELSVLVGTAPTTTTGYNPVSYYYGQYVSVGGLGFHTSQIVGVQFGSSVSGYTIPQYFLMGLINLDQPIVLPSTMTSNNNTTFFMYNCRCFNCPIKFASTNQVRFGNYFMAKCYSFNQPLDLRYFNYLNANYFMLHCEAFNSEITFPTSLNSSSRSIGTYFMAYCTAYNQPTALPSNCNSLGTNFMYFCVAYNQPFTNAFVLASSSGLNTYFMAYCYAFNQTLNFANSSFTSIPNNFLYCARTFNSPIRFPSGVTTIGNYFLAGTTGTSTAAVTNATYNGFFNQEIDLSKVTSIGTYFLAHQLSFNQPINLSKITTIGNYFMYNCQSFSQHVTLPSTLTSIGSYFMANILTTRSMTVNTAITPATSALAQTSVANAYANAQISGDCPAVTQGVTLYGTGRSSWITALPNSTSSPWRTLYNGGS